MECGEAERRSRPATKRKRGRAHPLPCSWTAAPFSPSTLSLPHFGRVKLPESVPESLIAPIQVRISTRQRSRVWPILRSLHESDADRVLKNVVHGALKCAAFALLL